MNSRLRRLRPWGWLVLAGLLALGLGRLRFDTEVLNLLPAASPAVQGLRLHQEHFAHARQLIITVRGRDAAETESAARVLAGALGEARAWVTDVRWQAPGRGAAGEAAELLAYLWINQPPAVFQELGRRLAEPALSRVLAEAREELATSLSPGTLARRAYDPLQLAELPGGAAPGWPGLESGPDPFSSADGSFRVLFVEAAGGVGGYRECSAWLGRVRAVVEAARQAPGFPAGVEVGYTGRPALVAEIGAGMEADFAGPSTLTLVIIAVLFYLAHRRWRPLLWLVVLLVLVLGATLAVGGLLYGRLNVVSLGFASILLGLAEDFGIVLYQESRSHPHLSPREVRGLVQPGIAWSAITTAAAFLLLNLSALPGLGQLGTLVAIGVLLGAVVMLLAYLPPLAAGPRAGEGPAAAPPAASAGAVAARWPALLSLLLLVPLAWAFLASPPVLDPSPESLRPRHSAAYATLATWQREVGRTMDPWWVLVPGESEAAVAGRLGAVQATLGVAVREGWLREVTLPVALWPNPEQQAANRRELPGLLARLPAVRAAAAAAGFTPEALALTEGLFATWTRALDSAGPFLPTNRTSRAVLEQFVARMQGAPGDGSARCVALGLVSPTDLGLRNPGGLASRLEAQGALLSGWNVLGREVFARVQHELPRVLWPMVGVLLLSLWLAFRRWGDVALSVVSLLGSGLFLHGVMLAAGWSWNLMNLMALPLLLGVGVDFSIHMILALRREAGDVGRVRRSVGRALLLAGATTIAGFGALAFASNAGIASLGRVCALGISCALLVAIGFLPAWWVALGGDRIASHPAPTGRPSSFYRAAGWRLALGLANVVPAPVLLGMTRLGTTVYRLVHRARGRVVVANLAPLFPEDPASARRAARALFANFARKLVDLWRYEAGQSMAARFAEVSGWEHFEAARARGRGVVLVTVHLGNWELGAPLLLDRGVPLQVVTQSEPDPQLTVLREAARRRRGVATLPLGGDPFAAVEILRRLEANQAVALLLDRPPAATATTVRLFGRAFPASTAAADLARASGCALVPVCVPHTARGYAMIALPEVPYDRASLRDPAARLALTQRLLDALAPAIARHASQWYHFVPVWPETPAGLIR